MSQLALETEYMTLEEVVADHAEAFDSVVFELEREALEESERDQELAAAPEFRPITVLREPDGEPR